MFPSLTDTAHISQNHSKRLYATTLV